MKILHINFEFPQTPNLIQMINQKGKKPEIQGIDP